MIASARSTVPPASLRSSGSHTRNGPAVTPSVPCEGSISRERFERTRDGDPYCGSSSRSRSRNAERTKTRKTSRDGRTGFLIFVSAFRVFALSRFRDPPGAPGGRRGPWRCGTACRKSDRPCYRRKTLLAGKCREPASPQAVLTPRGHRLPLRQAVAVAATTRRAGGAMRRGGALPPPSIIGRARKARAPGRFALGARGPAR